uniref:Uncharacterized protein n=1 Tax=Anguilla anguilla TaxID=7936 RepID=A0A0E9UC03_ANGAN
MARCDKGNIRMIQPQEYMCTNGCHSPRSFRSAACTYHFRNKGTCSLMRKQCCSSYKGNAKQNRLALLLYTDETK